MKNMLKERLKAGEQTIGLWVTIPSPDVTEVLSTFGFDWFVFDNEHSPLDIPTTQSLMQAMGGSDTVPLIRVPWNDIVVIKKSLDIGPYGLIIPWINSKKEAINAVKACKYPLKGIRGYGPRRPRYLDPDYVKNANEELLIMVQIETKKAVDNLEEIFSVEGVDGFYIGPMDLSASLGHLGNPFAQKTQDTIDKIFDVGKKAGLVSGIHGMGFKDVEKCLKQGFQFVCVGSDLGFISQGAINLLANMTKIGFRKKYTFRVSDTPY